jgi:hypothetical protein
MPEVPGLIHPKAIITLKVADDRDKVMWVTEEPKVVLARMANAREGKPKDGPMVSLSRWRGGEVSDFQTRHDNIVSVEAYH